MRKISFLLSIASAWAMAFLTISAQAAFAVVLLDYQTGSPSGINRSSEAARIIALSLSRAAPYSVEVIDGTLQVGFDELTIHDDLKGVAELEIGVTDTGKDILIVPVGGEALIQTVQLIKKDEGQALLNIVLKNGTAAGEALSEQAEVEAEKDNLVIAIDAGHGGIDPGAKAFGYQEKNLVLDFAKELAAAVNQNPEWRAVLTRAEDKFISLNKRRSIAAAAEADLFISIHADAIETGTASGLTIFTLDLPPRNQIRDELLTFHNSQSYFRYGEDAIFSKDLMSAAVDLGFEQTLPRGEVFAELLVEAIADKTGRSRNRPLLQADFAVLKNPGLPSVLVELGFITNQRDLANLLREDWRGSVIDGMLIAIDRWHKETQD